MDEQFAKELERIIDDTNPKQPALKAVPPKEVSLSEQWLMSDRIRGELRTRMANERFQIRSDYELQDLRIRLDYERKIEEAVAALEEEKRLALHRLADEAAGRIREFDLLAKRISSSA